LRTRASRIGQVWMKKWHYMLWGGVGAGKTTLLRALQGGCPQARKTQMVEFSGEAIDTPGEYSETRRLTRHLLATSAEAQLILVVQDATREDSNFPPNYFRMFHQPVVGVVAKMDAPQANGARAEALLRRIGVTGEIFRVSAVTGTGLSELRQSLYERRIKWHIITEAMEKHSA
jgi:ethanolamine utilization protein EutP